MFLILLFLSLTFYSVVDSLDICAVGTFLAALFTSKGLKMNIYNKYTLTKEQNIALARRNVIESIYKSAKLEGIAVTFPQTEAIYNGVNVGTLKVDDVLIINNLKHAWQFLFESMEYPKVDYAYICEINRIVGANNLFLNSGFLRKENVNIGGTAWQPDIPQRYDVVDALDAIGNIENATERAIELMLYIMRTQVFLDGNKRTATLCANRVLIENGAGMLNIKVEDIAEFKEKLIRFYETNQKDEIKAFLFENAINGINISEPTPEEKAEQEANTKKFSSYSDGLSL
jgi:fic family toxin-antitoxin system, toxin component